MADTAYYLDEEDRDFLDFLYRQYGMEKRTRTRPETRNPRSRSPYQPPLEATHPGPKVYVALVPPAGLPALNRSGTTGTGTADAQDDVPGEAECDVYRIDETPGTAGNADLLPIPGLTKVVYNLGDSVKGGRWVTVVRTESGAWVRAGGEGSTADDWQLTRSGCTILLKKNGTTLASIDISGCVRTEVDDRLQELCRSKQVVIDVVCDDTDVTPTYFTIDYITCPTGGDP